MQLIIVIISGISLGLMYVFSKVLANEKYKPATFSAVYSLLCAIIILPLAFTRMQLPTTWQMWLLAVISPIGFGLSFFFGMKAYRTTDVSVVALVSRLSIVVSSIFGILLLHDTVPKFLVMGLALILLGGIIISYEKKFSGLKIGIAWALLMALGYGLIAVFDKIILQSFAPLSYVFFNNVVVFIVFTAFIPNKGEIVSLIKEFPLKAILMSLFGVVSWASFLVIIQNFSLVLSYPIWESVALLTTVIVGIFVLKEKERIPQKALGTILTIVGIILLSL